MPALAGSGSSSIRVAKAPAFARILGGSTAVPALPCMISLPNPSDYVRLYFCTYENLNACPYVWLESQFVSS
jgi:hypothetical protein